MVAFGERGALDQMRGMIGAVGVVHLEANDLAAVEIEDRIQIEPAPPLGGRLEGHVPVPDFPRTAGDMRGWRRRTAGRLRPAVAVHLPMRAIPGGSWTHWRHTPFPGDQRCGEHAVLAAPDAARGLVQIGSCDHGFEPCRRSPAAGLVIDSVGETFRAPTLLRRDADPDLA